MHIWGKRKILSLSLRILHGRASYSGYRPLCGAYLNKEGVQNKLRVLNAVKA